MSTQDATPDTDVKEILTADHKEIVDHVGQIESTSDAGKRRDLADTVIRRARRVAKR